MSTDTATPIMLPNPARHAPALARLFGPEVAASELRGVCEPQLLLREELRCVSRARLPRRQEFAAGRVCARHAMAQLGIMGYALGMAADRQPEWPPGLVGSITHTQGYCGAVVAERRRMRSVGLDAEVVADVTPNLWPRICAPSERAWLGTLPAGSAQRAAALIFAAKEAYYKCQFPLTGEALGFLDVTVRCDDLAADHGQFSMLPQRAIELDRSYPPPSGRFRFHEGYVCAGVAVRDVGPDQ